MFMKFPPLMLKKIKRRKKKVLSNCFLFPHTEQGLDEEVRLGFEIYYPITYTVALFPLNNEK